eukprot:7062677-Pyramimonas_sp.AAC.1
MFNITDADVEERPPVPSTATAPLPSPETDEAFSMGQWHGSSYTQNQQRRLGSRRAAIMF